MRTIDSHKMENNTLTVPLNAMADETATHFVERSGVDFKKPWNCHVNSVHDFCNLFRATMWSKGTPGDVLSTLQSFVLEDMAGPPNDEWKRAGQLLNMSNELKHIAFRNAKFRAHVSLIMNEIVRGRVFESVYIDCSSILSGGNEYDNLYWSLRFLQARKLTLDAGTWGGQVLTKGYIRMYGMGYAKIDDLVLLGVDLTDSEGSPWGQDGFPRRSVHDRFVAAMHSRSFGIVRRLEMRSKRCCSELLYVLHKKYIENVDFRIPTALVLSLDMTNTETREFLLRVCESVCDMDEVHAIALVPDVVITLTKEEVMLWKAVIDTNEHLYLFEIDGLCQAQKEMFTDYLGQKARQKVLRSRNWMVESMQLEKRVPEERGCVVS